MIALLARWCCCLVGFSLVAFGDVVDARLGPLQDLNGYFPFTVPATVAEWTTRRAALRQEVSVALDLVPLPARPPLLPSIHGRREWGDYTIEKVSFQSLPGVYVTGSLYRPRQVSGKVPGVLCPHGHWDHGRFLDEPEAVVQQALDSGAERFACAARSPMQARCVQLARMGCVVFHYDMLGYADSVQVSAETAHKFAAQAAATPGGFFTPTAEGHLCSILGLQTWHGIRALDFLESLPDVDPTRLAVTGASGGGTQTFLLCAVDERPAAAFPAVMVSTAMQGGCTCENASLLRLHAGNVTLAALFAPKPLGMTNANDWTKDLPTKGLPELQQLYTLLGQPEHVSLTQTTPYPHNYNQLSRRGMERWFARHLLHLSEAPPEREFTFQTAADLTVWDAEHPAPASGPGAERAIVTTLIKAGQAALDKAPQAYRTGWQTLLQRDLASTGKCQWQPTTAQTAHATYLQIDGTVRNETHGEQTNVTFLQPLKWEHRVVVWLSELTTADGQPVPEVQVWLEHGWAVARPLPLWPTLEHQRKVPNPREAAAYTYGYNAPLLVQRVHDVLSLLKMLQTNSDFPTDQLALAAGPHGTLLAAAAGAMAGPALVGTVYDPSAPGFATITDIYDVNFLPGALKYGDLPQLTKLQAHPFPTADALLRAVP